MTVAPLRTGGSRPRIVLAAMGGTIAAVPDGAGLNRVDTAARDLAEGTRGLLDAAELVPLDIRCQHGCATAPEDMRALAEALTGSFEAGADGAVVTHGTDTLEETAYALALLVAPRRPLVLTGAMRPPGQAGADGPANVEAAVIAAATPATGRLGPVVVMHDELHLARWVTKGHTAAVGAFSSPGHGPVGTIVEGRPRIDSYPAGDDFLGLPAALAPRVELVWVAAGADGMLVEAAARVADGIVIAGTGGGHVPPAMVDAIEAAIAAGVPVVLASRTGAGPLLRGTYGGPGSETDLLRIGAIPAGALAPLKARLRLLVGLALELDPRSLFPV